MKCILRIGVLTLVGVVLCLFIFIEFLLSDLNPDYDEKEVRQLQSGVMNAEELPSAFLEVYAQVSPIVTTKGILYDWALKNYDNQCPCLNVVGINHHLYYKNYWLFGNRYIMSLKLERMVSQEECLSFLVHHYDFLYGNTDIYGAARFYFDKDFNDLDRKEFATLAIMLRNSSLYNPKKRPELIEERLKELGID
ncbi:MAG: hypothetical protein GC178_15235 [Flavobacteriales bacterium]|nr:hypothetical protein [Flavobacteriales bacterium]